MVKSFMELIAASDKSDSADLTRHDINRRISLTEVKTYAEIYPYVDENSLVV